MRFLTDSEREAANALKLARIKVVRRYIGAVLAFVAILGIGLFLSDERRKQMGDWKEVEKVDFSKSPNGPTQGEWLKKRFFFQNPEGTSEVNPWPIEKNAMVMKPHEWCWLKRVQIASDTKVVVHLQFTDTPEAFQICINAKKKLRQRDNNPPGYSCRFGIWAGAMDLITRNGLDRENDFNSLLSSPIDSRGGGISCSHSCGRVKTLRSKSKGKIFNTLITRRF